MTDDPMTPHYTQEELNALLEPLISAVFPTPLQQANTERDHARAVACALAARIREYAWHLNLTDLRKELMFAEQENDWLREDGRR